MKRLVVAAAVCTLTSLLFISCGYKASSSSSGGTSGLKFRAFVSQDIGTGILSPGLIIINAQNDVRALVPTVGGSTAFAPAAMFESNDKKITVSISSTGNSVQVVDNTKETPGAAGVISLPGATESVVIGPDNTKGYAAVPTAPVPGGGSSGAIALLNLSVGGTPGLLPIPSVHYLVQNGDGSKLLAFSDNSNSITIVSPFNITSGQKDATCSVDVCTTLSGFDRPIFGFFSSDSTQAWILNCGPECGGVQASVQSLDLLTNTAGPATPIAGGITVGMIKGQTLYLAGNPPVGSNDCTGGPATAATTCGRLTIVSLGALPSATPVQPTAVIPDGYHTHVDISDDGQLFVGSRGCTNIVPVNPGDEQRGCLAIFNTTNNTLIIPPDNGDVTGLQPITNRQRFYVIEGGELRIYDTNTDKLDPLKSIDIFGNAVDVKLIDF